MVTPHTMKHYILKGDFFYLFNNFTKKIAIKQEENVKRDCVVTKC